MLTQIIEADDLRLPVLGLINVVVSIWVEAGQDMLRPGFLFVVSQRFLRSEQADSWK